MGGKRNKKKNWIKTIVIILVPGDVISIKLGDLITTDALIYLKVIHQICESNNSSNQSLGY